MNTSDGFWLLCCHASLEIINECSELWRLDQGKEMARKRVPELNANISHVSSAELTASKQKTVRRGARVGGYNSYVTLEERSSLVFIRILVNHKCASSVIVSNMLCQS